MEYLVHIVDVSIVIKQRSIMIIAQRNVVLVVDAALIYFNVGRSFRNRRDMIHKVSALIIRRDSELVIRQIAMESLACLVMSFANAAHVNLSGGVELVVAPSRNAFAVNTLIECVIRARRSVDDSILQLEISRRLLETTEQLAFVFLLETVFWHPLCIVKMKRVERGVVIEVTALFLSKVERVVLAFLNVACTMLDPLADTVFSAVCR